MSSPKRAVQTEQVETNEFNWQTTLILIGVALGIFMGALESTIVGTAMPTVIATLGGIDIYSWVAVAYMLTSTVMTPIWGKMADLIGRRPAMFGGLALFILGSALSGVAHSMGQLIAFRALQGLGAGALFPVGMTIVADLLTLERRTRMIALFSGMWGLSSLFGPLAGGYLTEHLSWRWVFYINLPFGVLAGLLIWANYTERHERRAEIKLDYAGTGMLTLALIVLLLLVERISVLSAPLVLGMALACLALTVGFVMFERRSPEPLIPLDLFQRRMIAVTTLHGLFAGMMLFGVMLYLPLFVQAVLGATPTAAGGILTPLILAWVVSSIIGGRLILRLGYRPVVLAGMALLLLGSLRLALVTSTTTWTQLALAVILIGLGGGLTLASLMIGAQHAVPRAQLGVATSTVQFARSIGAALGIGVMGAVMSWKLRLQLARAGGELTGLAVQNAAQNMDVAALVRQSTRASLSPEALRFLQQALAGSLRLAFVVGLAMVIVAALVSLWLPSGLAHELVHPENHHDDGTAVVPEI
jgi:EmrB/QacA subfamily drug resistance transporter